MAVCPWCGPFDPAEGTGCRTVAEGGGFAYVCPTCDLTPAEHAYTDRILADSAAVYAAEHRAWAAKRSKREAA